MPELKNFTLLRDYKDEATTGAILDAETGEKICHTLERPKTFGGVENVRDNPKTLINESCCVPEGVYEVEHSFSKKFKKYMFLLNNVNSRDGIRMHCANWVDQLEGCIAFATKIEDKNPNKDPNIKAARRWNAQQSELALNKFMQVAPRNFRLTITSIDTVCNVKNI